MGRASGGSNTPHWIRNNILDFLRAMLTNQLCSISTNFFHGIIS